MKPSAQTEADRFYMGLALELAALGRGRTSPNPIVGCVVAREGRVLGRGHHPRAGEPHAEIYALREAGASAAGADLYVTLEPCSHQGRTPPCAHRIAASGVRRVVAAMEDPNPKVSGTGLRVLREAGVAVELGVREEEARRLNEAFALSIREGRAFVHLKLAATLDGKIATRTGESRWISSEESRLRVHRLRAGCGAVMVGVGTAVADDPRLTVRLPGEPERRILRVVIDPGLRAPSTLGIFSPEEAPHTLVACRREADPAAVEAFAARGVETVPIPTLTGPGAPLNLQDLLKMLYDRGIMEVVAEGGGETARSLLDQGMVDRVHLFYGPRLLGGRDSVPMVGGEGPDRIRDGLELAAVEVERVGPDIYVTGVPHRK